MSKTTTINLNELWCTGIDERTAIVEKDGQTVSRQQLFVAAQNLSKKIDGKRVAIFCRSSKLEAIAILAALRVHSPIILPATNQGEALREIRDAFDLLLTDDEIPDDIDHIQIEDFGRGEIGDVSYQDAPTDPNLKLSFFTSGSTGKPKEIAKYLFQIDNEIRVWARDYDTEFKSAEVLSTVSHQHIYGLLFRLLWPLCSGRPFHAETASTWEEISDEAQNGRPFILVSSPAHLTRLTPLEGSELSVQPLMTFSSGGVLQNEFASKSGELLGRPVLELYGSTETGGIAKRHNSGANEIWHPLPGVDVSQNDRGCLQVRSEFLPSLTEFYSTEDLVSFTDDGYFVLNGRADRIVKVEGKRVSLPRIEELLRKQDWVRDVFAKVVDGERSAVAAVVELNEQGTQYLEENGKFRTGRRLREYLHQYEDTEHAPRRWRFVEVIPRNQQGKIRAADIDALFTERPSDTRSNREIFSKTSFIEISRETGPDNALIHLTAPENLDYFKGHFTGTPLLPGVVQVHWAVQKSQEILGFTGQPSKIEKLKFKQFIFPDMPVVLRLEKTKPGKVSFSYESNNLAGDIVKHSSGILNFEDAR